MRLLPKVIINCGLCFTLIFTSLVAQASTTTPSATSTPSPTPTPTPTSKAEIIFQDIDKGYWAYDAIQNVVSKKIMNGYSDGRFGPDQPLTRAETTKVITLATTDYRPSTQTGATVPFSDVQSSDTLLPYIRYAYDQKMVRGYPDRTFKPTQSVSRAEFIKIFIVATDNQLQDSNIGEAFLDVPPSYELATYIYSARALGYIKGSTNGLFLPNAPITRAEAVKILNNYLNDQDMIFAAVSELEQKMFTTINEKRAAEKKVLFILDPKLSGVAKRQSQELYDQWHFLDKQQKKDYETSHATSTEQEKRRPWTSHRNAAGQTFDQWFALASKKYTITYTEASQNIAHAFYDNATPQDRIIDIINKMLEKADNGSYLYSHAFNIMGTYVGYTHVGIGIVLGETPDEMYVTQIFTK
ncbi:S-layer homology domain-containing protein [Candidatus Gracilibacteria bacterium]|nr:S-layer homology domain-containing protein [Candidatus Gracilibacteria bacterium]